MCAKELAGDSLWFDVTALPSQKCLLRLGFAMEVCGSASSVRFHCKWGTDRSVVALALFGAGQAAAQGGQFDVLPWVLGWLQKSEGSQAVLRQL